MGLQESQVCAQKEGQARHYPLLRQSQGWVHGAAFQNVHLCTWLSPFLLVCLVVLLALPLPLSLAAPSPVPLSLPCSPLALLSALSALLSALSALLSACLALSS